MPLYTLTITHSPSVYLLLRWNQRNWRPRSILMLILWLSLSLYSHTLTHNAYHLYLLLWSNQRNSRQRFLWLILCFSLYSLSYNHHIAGISNTAPRPCLFTHSQSHSHHLSAHYTCCYDEINGIQEFKNSRIVLMLILRFSLSFAIHTLLITCASCYDQIKGTQDKDFSYSFPDSLSRRFLTLLCAAQTVAEFGDIDRLVLNAGEKSVLNFPPKSCAHIR